MDALMLGWYYAQLRDNMQYWADKGDGDECQWHQPLLDDMEEELMSMAGGAIH